MTDKKDSDKKETLKMSRPNTLSLTKTVEGGKVKQNFQRGKSKTVTVEVRKTRTFTRQNSQSGMVEVKKDGGDKRYLSSAEREARLKALESAEQKSSLLDQDFPVRKTAQRSSIVEDEKPKDEAKEPEKKKSDSPLDEVAAKNLKTLKTEKPQEVPASPARAAKPAPRKTEAEEKKEKKEKMKLKRGEGRRSSGKLTVAQALGMQEERMRSLASIKRQRAKAKKDEDGDLSGDQEKIVREVIVPEVITVQELANRMAERSVDVIKALMQLGTMATAQQTIDADTAELIVEEFGHKLKRVSEADVEDSLVQVDDKEEELKPRPPVVTIMGHVDHGKTSLLDALRETDVVAGEAGGITQHIGAYQVQLEGGDKITFLDTPGHEAFTAMRARGAQVTDIVILVVAADDGIMPQTEEAINHAKAAGVPIIVAINKIDKPDADPEKVKNMLMSFGLVPEDFGGDIITVEVSALQKLNLDKLEEAILLQAEMQELKANPDRSASGVVIEAKMEKGRGTVASLLIQRGTLQVGDIVVAGASYGKIRAITNDRGTMLDDAAPALPVEVLGLSEPPEAGDEFAVVENEKTARDITEYRQKKHKQAQVTASTKTMDQLFAGASGDAPTEMPLIVKSDVHGSAEAIAGSMGKFNDEEVKVKIIHSAVGAINESDVSLAQTTNAMIVGFNVRATNQAKQLADREGVNIRYYSVIYDLVDDVKQALSGMLSPEVRENFLGYAEIREVFSITKAGKVAGCIVTDGVIKRGAKVRLLRDNVVIHEGSLKTLKRFKDEVKEVKNGFECGMAFENYDDIKVGDQIEAFELQEMARTIEEKKDTPKDSQEKAQESA